MREPLWGGREQARIACGGDAKRCPAGGRSRGVGRERGWRDACRESQDMAAQPVMSCAKRCRRHDSRKRVGWAGDDDCKVRDALTRPYWRRDKYRTDIPRNPER